jgi:hypothetical protein
VWALLIANVAAFGVGIGMWCAHKASSLEEYGAPSTPLEAADNLLAERSSRLEPKVKAPVISPARSWASTPSTAVSSAGKTRTREESMALLRDEAASVDDRHAALEDVAKNEGAESVNALIGVAETNPALREHAIILLAKGKSDMAAAFLATQLTNEDERVVCRAVVGLAQIKGVDAIPSIGALAESNRALAGGPSDAIWESCAAALGETRSSEALPVLERELKWVGEGGAHLEYGSQLIAALEQIGDSRAADMLHAYADHLQASLSGMPKIRQVQMVKIMETRKTAESLK